jgi:hypothetical protein
MVSIVHWWICESRAMPVVDPVGKTSDRHRVRFSTVSAKTPTSLYLFSIYLELS